MPDDDKPKDPQDGNGTPGAGKPSKCGSSAGGPAGDYESEQGAPRGLDEDTADDIIRETAQHAIGTADSEEVRAWAERELNIDRSAWMSALASAISGSIAAVTAPDGWVWPMRRDMADMGGAMLPRYTGHQPKCAVIIDTSGSITDEDINMAVAAGQFIAQVAEVTFYGCNTRATLYGSSLPDGLRGGGGTDLRVGIDAAIADGAMLVVVITDTYTPWHDVAPEADVIIGGGLGAPEAGYARTPDYAVYLPLNGGGE
jgi:hypothetical protein